MIREVNLDYNSGDMIATTDTGEKFVICHDVANCYGLDAVGTTWEHPKCRFQKKDGKFYIWYSDTNTIELE